MKIKNKYFRFFANAIFFLLIIVLIDQLIGWTLKQFYFSSKAGPNYQTTYALDSTKADIIILGSSRANHHYVSSIIEDSLGMRCYNTGRDGNYLFYSYGVFKAITKRYTPKVVILDISSIELFYDQEAYDGLSTLLPYYNTNQELSEIIELKSDYEKLKLLSSIYPYNSSIISIAQANLKPNMISDTYKGYTPLFDSNINTDTTMFVQRKNYDLDANKLNVLRQIVLQSNKLGIKLFIIISPSYNTKEQSNTIKEISSLADSNNVEFINYENIPSLSNIPSNFKNRGHLNNEGAKVFTKLISKRIKESMN